MPTFSLITVTYNAAETLADCINSVRAQSLRAEHIIIDGASTDGTLDIINSYRPDLAITISEPDKGIYDGMNKGLKHATGDIIGFLNADDFYADPGILEKIHKLFAYSSIASCYGDLLYVDPVHTDKICRYWKTGSYNYRKFYWGWMPPHPTFFVRRNIYEKYGNFNLELGSAADYELMLRFLVRYRITSSYLPEVIVKMRSGGISNASLKNRINANRNDKLAWKINELSPYPWTLFFKPLSKLPQYLYRPPR